MLFWAWVGSQVDLVLATTNYDKNWLKLNRKYFNRLDLNHLSHTSGSRMSRSQDRYDADETGDLSRHAVKLF